MNIEEDGDEIFTPIPKVCSNGLCRGIIAEKNGFAVCGVCGGSYGSTRKFEAWLKELKRIAKEKLGWSKRAIKSIDEVAMREFYFDEGMTPMEAWEEEYNAAR